MNAFWKRITAASLAAVMLTTVTVFAADTVTSQTIKDLQNQVNNAQDKAQQAAQDTQQSSDAKAQAEKKSQQLLNQINDLSDTQDELGNQIVDYQSQVTDKEQSYQQHLAEYRSQLKALQMINDSGSVAMLANAQSLYDLLSFAFNMQKLGSYTDQLLETLNSEKAALESTKEELEQQKTAAEENQKELESTRKEYQQQIVDLNQDITESQAEEKAWQAEYEAKKDKLQQAEQQMEQQIQAALQAAAQATPVPTPTATPTPTPPPTATPTPVPSDNGDGSSEQPGATPSPTPTPAPTPSPTPVPTTPPSTGLSMTWPLPGYSKLSTHFGEVIYGDPHYAIDIPAPQGTPIVAAADGTVLIAGWNYSYGNWALINHADGVATVYAHMADGTLAVSAGQTVTKGQYIGGVGKTGFADGNHLHFEVRKNGQKVDPLQYVSP